MRLFVFGLISPNSNCIVTKDEVRDCTFNGELDLQYLISIKRDRL